MALEEGELHAFAALGTVLVSAAMMLPFLLPVIFVDRCGNGGADAVRDPMEDMVVIEASLAMRKNPKKPQQPQKQFKAPDDTKKPDGVSRDENKKPDKKPDDEKDKKPDVKEPDLDISKYKRPDSDDPTGKVTEPFNPNASVDVGRDAETKGDPYFGKLKNDMNYQPPEIAKGDSNPIGCIRLEPDGKISDTKFKQTTDDDLQIAAETALKQLVKARNDKPEEVPAHLLQYTSRWICFQFSVKPS
ncbi:MAG: hypothetical protein NT062_30505 [Proteobacteria bacterium]|nr:hypothetical protein [Pseudomonadota bacterium]